MTMKWKPGTIVLILLTAAALFLAGRCSAPVSPKAKPAPEKRNDRTAVTAWTCSMHPQIRQPEPGACPICGMDLIPVYSAGEADEGPRTLTMSEAARALADIQTTDIRRTYPKADIRLAGRLDYDPTREQSLAARFPARIERLFVNFTGIRVDRGEHLAEVYSPDLLTAQRELITAHRADPDSSITRAARDKLLLWDLLPEQVDSILSREAAEDRFVLRAPRGGVVSEKKIQEGDYVKTGDPMFRIVDLAVLWLYLDAYESDLPWLRYGQDVAFTVEAVPGETFHGTIAFIGTEIDPTTRTVPVRVNVPNADGRLKPGMFARGVVASRIAADGRVYAPDLSGKWISPMHPEVVKEHPGQCDVCGMDLVPASSLGYVENGEQPPPIVVPASAVLRTGKRAVVYLEKTDTDEPTFEGREIVLGPRAGDVFVVRAGLTEGERVVTHGAFKIDSALQIQAKPSMMNPGDPPAEKDPVMHKPQPALPGIPIELAGKLIKPYLALTGALADDDPVAAREQLRAMMSITGHEGPMAGLIHNMMNADDLDGIRKPYFDELSAAMITAAHASPGSMGGDLLVMHCPMVYRDHGADWLQRSRPLRNPYFGSMMLSCGEVTDTITAIPGAAP